MKNDKFHPLITSEHIFPAEVDITALYSQYPWSAHQIPGNSSTDKHTDSKQAQKSFR